jgi:DNA-binding IscR family transcriptional regulator
LVDVAKRLLNEVKERKTVPASEWNQLMTKYNLSLSNYESVMQRLRAAGMLRKEKGVWSLSSDFAKYLTTASQLWYDWKGS